MVRVGTRAYLRVAAFGVLGLRICRTCVYAGIRSVLLVVLIVIMVTCLQTGIGLRCTKSTLHGKQGARPFAEVGFEDTISGAAQQGRS